MLRRGRGARPVRLRKPVRSYFQAFWTGIWRTTGSGVTLMLAPNDWAVASKRRNSEMRRSALVWDKANEDWR
jgi:hypothetical protein